MDMIVDPTHTDQGRCPPKHMGETLETGPSTRSSESPPASHRAVRPGPARPDRPARYCPNTRVTIRYDSDVDRTLAAAAAAATAANSSTAETGRCSRGPTYIQFDTWYIGVHFIYCIVIGSIVDELQTVSENEKVGLAKNSSGRGKVTNRSGYLLIGESQVMVYVYTGIYPFFRSPCDCAFTIQSFILGFKTLTESGQFCKWRINLLSFSTLIWNCFNMPTSMTCYNTFN